MPSAGDKGEFEYVVVLDGSGNPVTSFGGSGGTAMTDDDAFTPTSSSVTPVGFFVDDTATDSVDEGDIGAPRMTPDRVILVGGNVAHDDADSGRPVKMGGVANSSAPTSVTAGDRANLWLGLSGQTIIGLPIAGAGNDGTNPGFFTDGAGNSRSLNLLLFNGTNFDRMRGDATNGVDVDVTRLPSTTIAGTTAATGSGTAAGALRVELPTNGTGVLATVGTVTTVSTVSALGTGTTGPMKAEDVAHNTGDMGIPAWGVRLDSPNATAAASGDYHYLSTDMVGGIRTALYETDFAVLGTSHVKKYYSATGATTDGIVWSPAAGKRWYVTDLLFTTSAAATVTLEDDKAGGDEVVFAGDFAANSGVAHHFQTPLFSGEDAADLIVTTSAGNLKMTVVGYEI